MISLARAQMKTRSLLPLAENELWKRPRTPGFNEASRATTSKARTSKRRRESSTITSAAAASPKYATRSKVTATAQRASPTVTQRTFNRAAPATSPPAISAVKMVAIWPKVSREMKKPIAP